MTKSNSAPTPEKLSSLNKQVLTVFIGVLVAVVLLLGIGVHLIVQQAAVAEFKSQLKTLPLNQVDARPFRPGTFLIVKRTDSFEIRALGTDKNPAPEIVNELRENAPMLFAEGKAGKFFAHSLAGKKFYFWYPEQGWGMGNPANASPEREQNRFIIAADADPVRNLVLTVDLVFIGLAVIGSALGAVIVLWMLNRRIRPLSDLAIIATKNASRDFAAHDTTLLRVPINVLNSSKELAQVGNATNIMLNHLEQSIKASLSNEEKMRQFLADASHELRTPLTSLIGFAELLKVKTDLADDDRHSILRIDANAKRMQTLIEDLLLLARLDEFSSAQISDSDPGKDLRSTASGLDTVNVAELLLECFSDLQVAFPAQHFVLELPELEVSVNGKPEYFVRIFQNLISNAAKHSPAGTEVSVAFKKLGSTALLTVKDNGLGIPDELQPHIFDRFVKADESRTSVSGGSGLGLAITEALVRDLGGKITFSSQPGETIFKVSFPLAYPH